MENFFVNHIKPYLLYLDTHNSARYILVGIILLILAILLRDKNRKEKTSNIRNMHAIAGDDVMATQLDLAKAYIEMGQNDLAVTILKNVKRKGNITQQTEAQLLIKTL